MARRPSVRPGWLPARWRPSSEGWAGNRPIGQNTQRREIMAKAVVPKQGSALGHRAALDGVRAIAIVWVIGYHYNIRWLPGHQGGLLGVDLFFVLSGFLITVLLIQERDRFSSIRLRFFYGRR